MSIILRDKGCKASTVGYYLVIVGAVNWGLVGIGHFFEMNFNVVNLLLGTMPAVEALAYIIVGLSGVITFVGCCCATCKTCRADAIEAQKA